MLAHVAMPLPYWNEAFSSAMFLINKLPSQPIGNLSPYELIFHKKLDYMFLKTFGCLCFPNLKPYNKNKLQFKSVPCVFLGYSLQHKGYKCQDHAGKIYISRRMLFNESIFFF